MKHIEIGCYFIMIDFVVLIIQFVLTYLNYYFFWIVDVFTKGLFWTMVSTSMPQSKDEKNWVQPWVPEGSNQKYCYRSKIILIHLHTPWIKSLNVTTLHHIYELYQVYYKCKLPFKQRTTCLSIWVSTRVQFQLQSLSFFEVIWHAYASCTLNPRLSAFSVFWVYILKQKLESTFLRMLDMLR